MQRLFQDVCVAAQTQTQPREDQSPQLGPELSAGVGWAQRDMLQVPPASLEHPDPLTPDPSEDSRDRLEGDGASTYPLGKPESPSGSTDSPSIIQEPERDKVELKQGPA